MKHDNPIGFQCLCCFLLEEPLLTLHNLVALITAVSKWLISAGRTGACPQWWSLPPLQPPWLRSRSPPRRCGPVRSHERGSPQFLASAHSRPRPTPASTEGELDQDLESQRQEGRSGTYLTANLLCQGAAREDLVDFPILYHDHSRTHSITKQHSLTPNSPNQRTQLHVCSNSVMLSTADSLNFQQLFDNLGGGAQAPTAAVQVKVKWEKQLHNLCCLGSMHPYCPKTAESIKWVTRLFTWCWSEPTKRDSFKEGAQLNKRHGPSEKQWILITSCIFYFLTKINSEV